MAEVEGLIAALGEEMEEIVESSHLAKDSPEISKETITEAETLAGWFGRSSEKAPR